jgi:hypothetical protein
MGGQLSFIVLCILNSFVVSHGSSPNSPYVINGDDHVFVSTQELYSKYQTAARDIGFKVNIRKSLISRNYFSVNSELFRVRGSSPRHIPFLNMEPLSIYCPKDPTTLSTRYAKLLANPFLDK